MPYPVAAVRGHVFNQAASAAFSPSDIASLEGWWDGSDATTLYTDAGSTLVSGDADAIYQWNDKSGSGKNMTQVTLGARPLYKVGIQNSLSAVFFDGSDDLIKLATQCDPRTGFIVARAITGLPNDAALFAGIDNSTNRTGPLIRQATLSNLLTASENIWYTRVRANGVLTNNITFDSFVIYSGTATSASNLIRQFGNDRGIAGRNWKDYICECVIFNTELSTAGQNSMGEYLADKWNISWTTIT